MMHVSTELCVGAAERVRLCLKDLFHHDVVEMIERETRKYSLWDVTSSSDPLFDGCWELLWEGFGEAGEVERREVIAASTDADPFFPTKDGTFHRYFLLAARDRDGRLLGVRDGSILVNPAYDPSLCVIYLAHIYMRPEARGSVLSYWLRIAPVELATQYLKDLHSRGLFKLPAPDQPGRYFGMRMNLAAEMEYYTPEERQSWQRILFYGRGGFDAINPRHFPYRQPDFRDPAVIRETGNRPVPFMVLLRRMGRERQATLPIAEAQAVMNLLYDDFAEHCSEEHLQNSLDVVMDRLERRARRENFVELLPLPTGPRDIHRFKRLFRYSVYKNYYGDAPDTRDYLRGPIAAHLKANRRYLEESLADIARELEGRPHWVYGNRQQGFSWEGHPIPETPSDADEGQQP
jgi:hypothetical protein